MIFAKNCEKLRNFGTVWHYVARFGTVWHPAARKMWQERKFEWRAVEKRSSSYDSAL